MTGTTWILVADAARARVLAWRAGAAALDEIETFSHAEGRLAGHDLVSDGPGRTRGGKGFTARSSMDPRTDPREAEEDRFARDLGHLLDQAAGRRYDELVLVAPPAFLGRLRGSLGKAAADRVTETVARDFTRLSPAELPPRLGGHLEWLKPKAAPRHLPNR